MAQVLIHSQYSPAHNVLLLFIISFNQCTGPERMELLVLTSEIKKKKFREVMWLAQGHTADAWQRRMLCSYQPMPDGDASLIPLGPCEPLLCPKESYHLGYPGLPRMTNSWPPRSSSLGVMVKSQGFMGLWSVDGGDSWHHRVLLELWGPHEQPWAWKRIGPNKSLFANNFP